MSEYTEYTAAAMVLVQVLGEPCIVLIRDFSQPYPEWKFPGGHYDSERDSDPRDTALEETKEESGVIIPREMMPVHEYHELRYSRKDSHPGCHDWYSLCFVVDSIPGLRSPDERSVDNEQAGLFPFSAVRKMIRKGRFLKSYIPALEAHLKELGMSYLLHPDK